MAVSRYTAPELYPSAPRSPLSSHSVSSYASAATTLSSAGTGSMSASPTPATIEDGMADVYSAAMVIWALRVGRRPHPHLSDAEAAAAAADPSRRLRPAAAALRWRGLAAVLEHALASKPLERPTADELLAGLEGLAEKELARCAGSSWPCGPS